MVENIQSHIGSLNWGYRVALRDKNVKYINALATLEDAHTIKVSREKAPPQQKSINGLALLFLRCKRECGWVIDQLQSPEM